MRLEDGEGDLADAHPLVGALDREPAALELQVVGVGLEQVRRNDLGLLDHLLGGLDDRDPTDHQRTRAIGVQALVRDGGVAVQHLDILEGHAELVGDDLAECRLVPLAVRAGTGEQLDLAGRQHPDRRRLPTAADVGQ